MFNPTIDIKDKVTSSIPSGQFLKERLLQVTSVNLHGEIFAREIVAIAIDCHMA